MPFPQHFRRWPLPLLAAGLVSCSGPFPQTVFQPVSDFGVRLNDLYLTVFWWAVAVFVVVEALLMYVLIRYRARPGAGAPARGHGNTILEIAWTMAPVLILLVIAVPTMKAIFESDGTPAPGALQIDVVGHQWWWEYRYHGLDPADTSALLVTANELHIPKGRPVGLALTSDDVIHSFWAPRLGGKRDVIRGQINRLAFTADSTGEYLGQCAEFCGASHANMRLRVVVDDSAAFAAWVRNQQAPPVSEAKLPANLKAGLEVFTTMRDEPTNSCLVCHTIAGFSAGTMGPNLTHLASRGTIAGGTIPNTAEGLARWLRDPPAAKPGSIMPRVGLTEDEISRLVPYLMSLK